MTTFAVKKQMTPEEAIKAILTELLATGAIEALFAPAVTPWSQLPMPHLFVSPDHTDRLAPLAPVMPFNAARQAMQVLRETRPKKIAVVLRPCEIRALIELAKLNQCVLDEQVLIIGIECLGRLDNAIYLKGVERNPAFPVMFYRDERIRNQIEPACLGCTDFFPEQADMTLLTLGREENALYFALNSEAGRALAEKNGLDSVTDIPLREKPYASLKQQREALQKEQFKTANAIMASPADFQKKIATCINCQNCRTACPVCYCRECVFNTDVFDVKPDLLFRRAQKKAGIKLPQDTSLFHMTRMLHIAHACVGCGQCSSVCPQSIPIADFFRAAADKTQRLFRYKPGRDKDEKIPMLSFGAENEENA